MRRSTQVEVLRQLIGLRETGGRDQMAHEGGGVMRIPVRRYTDQAVLDRELETVFRDHPFVLGHASHVREPGRYLLCDWKSRPIVAVRGKDGVLRAFLNTCRHRGARMLTEQSETPLRAFVCPFHGWVYGLDGSLRGVTKDWNFPDLDRCARGLVELPVAEHGGLVWVHPRPDGNVDMAEQLGPIGDDIVHFGIDRMKSFRKSHIVKQANWKLLIKTYLEGYHVPYLHRDTIAQVFHNGVIAHLEHGPHIRLCAGRVNLLDCLAEDPDDWQVLKYASVYYTLFPCTFFIMHPDYVSINQFYPLAPDQTLWTHEMLYDPSLFEGERGQSALAKRFDYTNDIVFDKEDFLVAEDVQIGLRDGANEHHVLGLEERLLHVFQQSIDQATGPVPHPGAHP